MSRAERNPFQLTESDIYEAFSSILSNNNNVTRNLQASLNFLSTRDTGNISNASNALDALQGYGPGIQSPSYITNYDRNADSTNKTFSNLHLNSVEEEDEFLYGDSNSVDEEHISTKKDSFTINTSRHNTGWSDDEDPYSESSGPALSKLSSRLKKNLSNCDSQNKTYETENFSYVKRDVIEEIVPSAKTTEQKYLSHQTDTAALSPKTDINQFPVSETSSLGKAKSKYHVAAEILKKRIVEKTNSSPSEKLSTNSGPGTSKKFSELEYQSIPTDFKTDKPVIKRQIPKTINRKHLANIRNYITGAPRKRVYPREELGPEKHPRYESPRSSSPSRYSTQKSSLPSYKHKSEIDHIKYASPYSRHRSPSYEYERRHSKYSESHRRYSPSPKRWSHEKSPDYRRRDRSPRSRRSRSRSPGYYSSRSKTYEKKKVCQSPKKSDYYSKKKEKSKHYSSSESFCSLSLGSSSSRSSSSSSSDESSDEKKKSKKPSIKVASKDNKKLENEIINLKDCDDTHSKKPDNTLSEDTSKKSDIFNAKNNDVVSSDLLNSENVAHLVSALQPSDNQRLLIEFLEGLQQHQQQQQQQQQQQPSVAVSHSTYTSPAVADINIASNLQMPVISTSESYIYPTAPVQYMASQVPNFPQMIQSSAFPASVMTPMAPTQYGPYLPMPSVPSPDSQYITNVVSKSGKVRHTTLRPVPMSDTTGVSTNILPNNPALQKSANSSLETTKSKSQESKFSKFSKQSSEKRSKNFKESEKNANSSYEKNLASSSEKNINSSYEKNLASSSENNNNSSSKHTGDSTSEQNKNLIIEKFKRMKNERAEAINKSKSATQDLDEMRKMLDETFGKRINASEKSLYTRCKTLFNLCLDTASTFNESARRSDEDLNKFKAKLSTSLQEEVSKIKLEQCKEEPVINERYSCLDQGDHYCYDCHRNFKTVKGFLQHIQTPGHIQNMETSKNEWKKDFIKEQKQDSGDQKKSVLKAIKGAEFLKPLTGFYCSLCKEVILDEFATEQHVKSHQHYVNYMNFLKRNPLYERKCLFKNYIQITVASKQQRILDVEEKKKKEAERKKNQEAAEKKSKEILLSEKSKEVVVVELEEKESDELPPSVNQKATNIKLNLSEKDKDEKKKSSNEQESKNPTKFIYIGKAPNYKKNQAQKPTRWYKRENILNKKEPDADTSSPNVMNATEKQPEKSSSPEVKLSNTAKKSETSSFKNDNSTKPSSDIFLKHEDKTSVSEKKDSAVKQVIKSNLCSSNLKHVPLSEITLPELSSLPSTSDTNTPQPMDIDNSQDIQNAVNPSIKPKSEEEKDFFLLGINKEDFKPLVVPVPPPTSMVSYPNLSNSYSNAHCSSSSTPSIEQSIKSFDFSVPPPTIAPYQSNVAHMPVYGPQSNSQNTGHYPYPTNNSQMSLYSNPTQVSMQTDYRTLPQYSTPPPVFRNPPPVLPYSNTSNMPSAHQYSSSNSMLYNTSFSNSIPQNLNNQSYQPSVYSAPPSNITKPIPPNDITKPIPPNNKTPPSLPSTSQNLIPPGSTCDSSFTNITNFSIAPIYNQSNKIAPTLQKVGNLIRIVPEKAAINESASDSKHTKLNVKASANIKVFPSNDVDKSNKNDEKEKLTEKTRKASAVNDGTLKTSEVVPKCKESSYSTSDSNKRIDKHSFESEVKCIIDECIQKLELNDLENCNTKGYVKSSLIVEAPIIFDNSTNSNELIKSAVIIDEVSNIKIENEANEKQIPGECMEVEDNVNLKKPISICSNKTDDLIDSESISMQNSINVSNNSVLSTEKYSIESCFLTENSSNRISEKSCVVELSNMSMIEEKNAISDSCHDLNAENKNVKLDINTDEVLEENKESLKDIHLVPTLMNDPIGSNHLAVSNNEIEHKNNENGSCKTSVEICEKQVPTLSMEVCDSIEKSSNEVSSLLDDSNKTVEIIENNCEAVLSKNSAKVVNDSSLSKLDQNNSDNTSEFLSDASIESKLDVHENKESEENKKLMENVDVVPTLVDDTVGSNHAISDVGIEHKNKENGSEEIDIKIDDYQLMEIDDNKVSMKSSTECYFPSQSSHNKIGGKDADSKMPNVSLVIEKENISCSNESKIYQKCEDLEMPNISTMIEEEKMYDSGSYTIEKDEDLEMPNIMLEGENIDDSSTDINALKKNSENYADVDDVLEEERRSANPDPASMLIIDSCHHEVSNVEMEYENNKNDSGETSETNESVKEISAQSMEIDDNTVLEKASNIVCSSNTNEAAGGSIHDSETVLSKKEQINVNCSNEFPADSVSKDNHKNNNDQLMEIGGDIVSEKPSIDSCFLVKSPSNEIDENSGDFELTNKNMQKESTKSYLVFDENVLKENKNSLEHVHMEPLPIIDISIDTDNKNIMNTKSVKHANPEIYKENQTLEILKENQASEEEQKNNSTFIENSEPLEVSTPDNSTFIENLEPLEVSAPDNSTFIKNLEPLEVPAPDQVFIESMNSEDILQHTHLKLHKSQTDEENSDNKIEAPEKSGYEDSRFVENSIEVSKQSGDQDNEVVEKKIEISAETVTEIIEETDVNVSNKRCSGSKDSSDTEEYEDD